MLCRRLDMQFVPQFARTGVAVVCVWSAPGLAQPESAIPVRVAYTGHEGCPDTNAFLERVLERTSLARVAEPGEEARTLVVNIVRDQEASAGTISLVDRQGATSTREVVAPACEQVVSALALVASVSIDQESTTEPPQSGQPDSGSEAAAEPRPEPERAAEPVGAAPIAEAGPAAVPRKGDGAPGEPSRETRLRTRSTPVVRRIAAALVAGREDEAAALHDAGLADAPNLALHFLPPAVLDDHDSWTAVDKDVWTKLLSQRAVVYREAGIEGGDVEALLHELEVPRGIAAEMHKDAAVLAEFIIHRFVVGIDEFLVLRQRDQRQRVIAESARVSIDTPIG